MIQVHGEIADAEKTTPTQKNVDGKAPPVQKLFIQPREQVIYLTFSAGNSKHAWLSTHWLLTFLPTFWSHLNK